MPKGLCPLFQSDCKEQECIWYYEESDNCAVTLLATILNRSAYQYAFGEIAIKTKPDK